LSDLGVRAAIAKRVMGGLARAIRDPLRLQELLSVIAAPRKTFAARLTEEVQFPLFVTNYTGSGAGQLALPNQVLRCRSPRRYSLHQRGGRYYFAEFSLHRSNAWLEMSNVQPQQKP
jgi:hypothetical protein